MLEHLYIKSVALINEINIDFKEGLNILSGETGAGKSIIIDSINFVLGERAGKDFIHKGDDKAFVEAIMSINNTETEKELEEYGIETDEDKNIMLSRSINSSGKNICKINGKTITVGMLKELSAFLIDIHGQHEHQSLLNANRHIILLDRFCGEELENLKAKLNEESREYRKAIKAINDLGGDSEEKEKRIDYYKYQLEEIENADLKINEEEELNERFKILSSTEKLKELAESSLEELSRAEDNSANSRIGRALSSLYQIKELDSSQGELCQQLEEAKAILEDTISAIRNYDDNIEYNPMEIKEIGERLDIIYSIKRKYGKSIEEILRLKEELKENLAKIENSEADLIKLREKKNEIEKEIKKICREITDIRKKAAEKIEGNIVSSLKDLGMKNAQFKINILNRGSFNSNGWDKVEFLISPNLGEELKPLAKIASGGEMSRVMLAMKEVLATADNIETFIFDEIDTGVSGRTAQQVAEKLANIGMQNQILCITHLPQIAAMGDNNYLIEKKSDEDNGSTRTIIKEIENDEVTKELARLIGGAEITEATLSAAKEMKELAVKKKEKK